MTRFQSTRSRTFSLLCGLFLFVTAPDCVAAGPTPAAVAAFNSYTRAVETRLVQQHRSQSAFLAPADSDPQSAPSAPG